MAKRPRRYVQYSPRRLNRFYLLWVKDEEDIALFEDFHSLFPESSKENPAQEESLLELLEAVEAYEKSSFWERCYQRLCTNIQVKAHKLSLVCDVLRELDSEQARFLVEPKPTLDLIKNSIENYQKTKSPNSNSLLIRLLARANPTLLGLESAKKLKTIKKIKKRKSNEELGIWKSFQYVISEAKTFRQGLWDFMRSILPSFEKYRYTDETARLVQESKNELQQLYGEAVACLEDYYFGGNGAHENKKYSVEKYLLRQEKFLKQQKAKIRLPFKDTRQWEQDSRVLIDMQNNAFDMIEEEGEMAMQRIKEKIEGFEEVRKNLLQIVEASEKEIRKIRKSKIHPCLKEEKLLNLRLKSITQYYQTILFSSRAESLRKQFGVQNRTLKEFFATQLSELKRNFQGQVQMVNEEMQNRFADANRSLRIEYQAILDEMMALLSQRDWMVVENELFPIQQKYRSFLEKLDLRQDERIGEWKGRMNQGQLAVATWLELLKKHNEYLDKLKEAESLSEFLGFPVFMERYRQLSRSHAESLRKILRESRVEHSLEPLFEAMEGLIEGYDRVCKKSEEEGQLRYLMTTQKSKKISEEDVATVYAGIYENYSFQIVQAIFNRLENEKNERKEKEEENKSSDDNQLSEKMDNSEQDGKNEAIESEKLVAFYTQTQAQLSLFAAEALKELSDHSENSEVFQTWKKKFQAKIVPCKSWLDRIGFELKTLPSQKRTSPTNTNTNFNFFSTNGQNRDEFLAQQVHAFQTYCQKELFIQMKNYGLEKENWEEGFIGCRLKQIHISWWNDFLSSVQGRELALLDLAYLHRHLQAFCEGLVEIVPKAQSFISELQRYVQFKRIENFCTALIDNDLFYEGKKYRGLFGSAREERYFPESFLRMRFELQNTVKIRCAEFLAQPECSMLGDFIGHWEKNFCIDYENVAIKQEQQLKRYQENPQIFVPLEEESELGQWILNEFTRMSLDLLWETVLFSEGRNPKIQTRADLGRQRDWAREQFKNRLFERLLGEPISIQLQGMVHAQYLIYEHERYDVDETLDRMLKVWKKIMENGQGLKELNCEEETECQALFEQLKEQRTSFWERNPPWSPENAQALFERLVAWQRSCLTQALRNQEQKKEEKEEKEDSNKKANDKGKEEATSETEIGSALVVRATTEDTIKKIQQNINLILKTFLKAHHPDRHPNGPEWNNFFRDTIFPEIKPRTEELIKSLHEVKRGKEFSASSLFSNKLESELADFMLRVAKRRLNDEADKKLCKEIFMKLSEENKALKAEMNALMSEAHETKKTMADMMAMLVTIQSSMKGLENQMADQKKEIEELKRKNAELESQKQPEQQSESNSNNDNNNNNEDADGDDRNCGARSSDQNSEEKRGGGYNFF